jgi:hypothetical protein
MRKIALASIVFLLLAAAAAFGQETVSPPPEGTYWQYRAGQENWPGSNSTDLIGNYELIWHNSRLTAYKISGDQRIEISDNENTEDFKCMVAVSQCTKKYVELPLSEGQHWIASYDSTLSSPRGNFTTKITTTNSVKKGIKEISVVAGTFNALEIEREFHRSSLDGYVQNTYSYFYSSDCHQCIVKFQRKLIVGTGGPATRNLELIGFGRRGEG